MKKPDLPEISPKNTKEQILAAYGEILEKLNEKQAEVPLETRKKEEERSVVTKAATQSPNTIISELANIKLKAIKQLDGLSEELLGEFQKLSDIRQAISSEQQHLEELYQIKETANTLAALFQAHIEQKEKLHQEREQKKQEFDQWIASRKLQGQEEQERFERNFNEHKENQEKERKREEEDYIYTRDLKRRQEMDSYNAKKTALEKELGALKEDLQKREEVVNGKENLLVDLQAQVDKFPEDLRKAVMEAEEKLQEQILQRHDFESQIKQKELEGLVKIHSLQVTSLQGKIKEQEALIKELSQKADQATENVQLIACRALDTSSQRYVPVSVGGAAATEDRVATSQK
jgi:hypothetical protein